MTSGRTTIASRKFWAVDKEGREFELTIAVGEPCETPENWVCRASVEGMHERSFNICGVDSWQALQLAYEFSVDRVIDFVEKGGRLLSFEEREPIAPEELLPRVMAHRSR
jgi:hypothetical protein